MRRLGIAVLLALAACGQKDAAAPSGVIGIAGNPSELKVNGETVPEAMIEAFAKQRGWNVKDPGQRQQVIDSVADLVAMAQEAKARGLLDDPILLAELEVERLNRLSGEFVKRSAPEPTEAELRAAYDQEVANNGATEFQAAHVLFDNQAAADAAVIALNTGTSFDDLIASSQGQAGVKDAKDLGWVRRPQVPPPLADALEAMAEGAITPAPVQTEYGFHVALLRARRPFQPPVFESVRDGVKASIQRKRALDLAAEVKAKAKIER